VCIAVGGRGGMSVRMEERVGLGGVVKGGGWLGGIVVG